jgi:hypothetical protein
VAALKSLPVHSFSYSKFKFHLFLDVNKRKLSGKYESLYQEIAMVTRNASGRPGSKHTEKQGGRGHLIDNKNRIPNDDTDEMRLRKLSLLNYI